jgi:hypothetical protein
MILTWRFKAQLVTGQAKIGKKATTKERTMYDEERIVYNTSEASRDARRHKGVTERRSNPWLIEVSVAWPPSPLCFIETQSGEG